MQVSGFYIDMELTPGYNQETVPEEGIVEEASTEEEPSQEPSK